MPRFQVWFSPDALDDILSAYEWGRFAWGDEGAERWIRELHEAVYLRLTEFPASCSIAPETSDLGFEVRQFIFLRYRVLFEIDRRRVIILHVRGPHVR